MLVKIGQPVDHGFDAPLGLLSDCHRRIERFLDVLLVTTEARRGGVLEPADRAALQAALRYFITAAPRHSADEEESLFPRLRSAQDPDTQAALATLARLEADHRIAEAHHEAVDMLGRRWLIDGSLPPAEAEVLREHLVALRELYRVHIALEDQELFPAAARVLSADDLESVGREMAARRNVAFAPPPGMAG